MNKPLTIWFYFGCEKMPLLRKLAAHALCVYAAQAARSGVRLGDLATYPGLIAAPHRLARRFKLGDFWGCILRAYYQELPPKLDIPPAIC